MKQENIDFNPENFQNAVNNMIDFMDNSDVAGMKQILASHGGHILDGLEKKGEFSIASEFPITIDGISKFAANYVVCDSVQFGGVMLSYLKNNKFETMFLGIPFETENMESRVMKNSDFYSESIGIETEAFIPQIKFMLGIASDETDDAFVPLDVAKGAFWIPEKGNPITN